MKRFFCLLLLLSVLLCACNSSGGAEMPETDAGVTDSGENAAETDEETPLTPYTLRYSLTDLTEQLPQKLLDTVRHRQHYIKDGTLYLSYVSGEPDLQEMRLLPITSDGIAEPIRVPGTGSGMPIFGYAASGERFVLMTHIKYEPYICVTDAGGTVLASILMPHPNSNTNHYHISEDADSNLYILTEYGNEYYYFFYDAAQNQLEQVRMYRDEIMIEPNFGLSSAVYLGSSTWLGSNNSAPAKLDMSRGTLQRYSVRLPGELMFYTFIVGADGEVYFLDRNGVYQYRGNASPVMVLDYDVCSFSLDGSENNRLWIVDENEFFVLTYETVDGIRHPRFYQVQTEYVPDTDSRPYIEILSYSKSEWLTGAVNRFNAENPSYRVKIQYVDVRNRDHEELNAELQEKILYQSHPDILVWGDSPWRPLDQYYDKNTFLDLMPHFGDQLLGCVREAASYGDALYSVPTDLWLQTFVCAEDITDTYLTWDTFFDVIDRTELPAVLTSEPMAAAQIWDNGIMDFCDFDTMSSYYNTEQFRNMVTYCHDLEHQIYEEAGRIAGDIYGEVGYTNATLPARLADGGLAFLTVPVEHLNHILAPMLLYGDADFTWCGYPSREGGGAYLNMANHQFSVFSDTDLAEGCIAFLSLLLSDEEQSDSLHPYLPVTESGMRRLIRENRYFYYETQQYQKIGDPNATPTTSAGGLLSAMSKKVIYLAAQASAAVYYEDYGEVRGDDKDYTVVELTDDYAEAFLDFLNNCHMKAGLDLTLKDIITEEISYWQNDARTLEETTKIIDSRVWIYLNE